MKNFKKQFALVVVFALALAIENVKGQNVSSGNTTTKAAEVPDLAKLRAAVEANPNDFDTHLAYVKATKYDAAVLTKQYDEWIKKYPQSSMMYYSIGKALANRENPNAKPYLLKAIELNPKLAMAYQDLSIDAQRWGDFDAARAYLKKASEVDPENASYALSYAFSMDEVDSVLHHQLMLSIPERFPKSERGAQALYWLAFKTHNPVVKEEIYDKLRKKMDHEKSSWISYGMQEYYGFLLEREPSKALALSSQMLASDSLEDRKDWEQRRDIAKAIVTGRDLIKAGKYQEAIAAFDKVAPLRRSSSETVLPLEKAKAVYLSGQKQKAYDTLLHKYAAQPSDEMMEAIKEYGHALGKNDKSIQQEIWTVRKSKSEPATVFNLDNYLSPGKTSLKDLRGKVVLITYWFPGCGPCRNEFPHFENVVRKFKKDKLAYVGINIVHEQDPYVVSFLTKSGYSFIPVRDEKEKRGNLIARGAPTNYLLDKEGNIVFKNFMIHGHNERMLELMISELLDK